jgi:putative SOS response-associated peptidase YedK
MLVIRRNHRTGEVSLDPLRWGLIPHFCEDPKGGRKPINAKCETVSKLTMFRDVYRRRRCILPVDGFFEWKAIKGKAKQPYAIAMRDGYPFGIGGLWENWKDPTSGEWIRTFAIIPTDANELVAEIHDRMPLIIAPGDHRYQEHPALTELGQCTDDLSESLQRQTASRNDLDQSVESANGR